MNQLSKFALVIIVSFITIVVFQQTIPIATAAQDLALTHIPNLISQLNATPSSTAPLTPSSSDLTQNLIVAFVSAFLGFMASLLVEKYKKRSEPKFQISYLKVVKKGIVEIENDIKSKVSVLYNNCQAQSLYYFLFDIQNTGNRTIKEQEIRFEFSNGAEIIDIFYCPSKPEPEINLEQVQEVGLSNYEKKYKVGYFENGKKIGFRFIVASPNNNDVTMNYFTKNANQDVIFAEKSAVKKASEVENIRDFIFWLIILIVVPSTLENILHLFIFRELVPIFTGFIRLSALIIIIQKLENFVKSITEIVSNTQLKKGMSIELDGSKIDYFIIQGDESTNAIQIDKQP
jgi:hypothetical protein